jgi:hypothetical protein
MRHLSAFNDLACRHFSHRERLSPYFSVPWPARNRTAAGRKPTVRVAGALVGRVGGLVS